MSLRALDWDDVRGDGDRYVAVGKALEARYGPPPAGARSDNYWGRADTKGIRSRDVYWPKKIAGDVDVYVEGTQFSDGRITARVTLYFENDQTAHLDATNVRELATAIMEGDLAATLLAAAEQLDQIAAA